MIHGTACFTLQSAVLYYNCRLHTCNNFLPMCQQRFRFSPGGRLRFPTEAPSAPQFFLLGHLRCPEFSYQTLDFPTNLLATSPNKKNYNLYSRMQQNWRSPPRANDPGFKKFMYFMSDFFCQIVRPPVFLRVSFFLPGTRKIRF